MNNMWKEILLKLTEPLKKTPILAYALMVVIILALLGSLIAPVDRPWLWGIVIGAMVIYFLQVVVLEIVRLRSGSTASNTVHPFDKPAAETTPTVEQEKPVAQEKPDRDAARPDSPPLSEEEARDRYLDSLIRELRPMRMDAFDRNAGDLDSPETLMLDSIYIALNTETPRKEEREERESDRVELAAQRSEKRNLTVMEALLQAPGRRIVLLGKPGTGKTTFVRYLALGMAKVLCGSPIEDWQWTGQPLMPVVVRLGDFTEHLPESNPGDADLMERFIVSGLEKDRTGKAPYAAYLLAALKREGGIVLFDGLDEISNLKRREVVVKSIQSFTDQYGCNPNSYFLVTCRTFSYIDRRWKLENWQQHKLALLSDVQITQFVTDWYRQHGILKPNAEALYQQKSQELSKALDPHRSDRTQLIEIARYPIVLTVIAVVHATRKLPEHTVEVYKECVELLLERWRIFRRIGGQTQVHTLWEELGVVQKTLYAALNELAFEAHRGLSSNSVDRSETQITDNLLWGVLVKHLQLEQAKKFCDYCNLSNGLLMLRGVQPGKDKDRYMYAFPHRTFQEYLASQYLLEGVQEGNCEQVGHLLRTDFELWREVVKFLGEYSCYDKNGSVRDIRDVLDQLAPKSLPEKVKDNDWRMIWLAGDLLKSYREIYRSKPYDGDQHIVRNLHRLVQTGALDLRERAAAADTLDALGYLPEGMCEFIRIPVGATLALPEEALSGRTSLPDSGPGGPGGSPRQGEFWIARYPITNIQYERFLKASDYAEDRYWTRLPVFACPDEGYKALKPLDGREYRREQPGYWDDPVFGIARKGVPVVGVTWYQASAFCKWLQANWDAPVCADWKAANPSLPTEAEWLAAALTPERCSSLQPSPKQGEEGLPSPVLGEGPGMRAESQPYPWSRPDDPLDSQEEVLRRANVDESDIGRTTPVDMYPAGKSALEVWDLSGNVWEWQANFYSEKDKYPVRRGGSWRDEVRYARMSIRRGSGPFYWSRPYGFRVGVSPI